MTWIPSYKRIFFLLIFQYSRVIGFGNIARIILYSKKFSILLWVIQLSQEISKNLKKYVSDLLTVCNS